MSRNVILIILTSQANNFGKSLKEALKKVKGNQKRSQKLQTPSHSIEKILSFLANFQFLLRGFSCQVFVSITQIFLHSYVKSEKFFSCFEYLSIKCLNIYMWRGPYIIRKRDLNSSRKLKILKT